MMRVARRFGLTVGAVALLAGVAGCGGDDDTATATTVTAGTSTPGTTVPAATTVSAATTDVTAPVTTDVSVATTIPGTTAAEGDGAAASFPVTIEHRFGSTTIEQAPTRIVSLDPQWTDVLDALDAPLAAAIEAPGIDGGRFPWQQLPESVESIPVADTIPFEAVAALQPDLIVITYFATDQATYDLLAAIAPTIGPLGDEQVDRWQDLAVTAGRVLGTPDAATALIDGAEQASADVLAELPGLAGLDYALASYVPGTAIYVVADPDDGASQLFAQLGMSIDPDLLAIADGASGRAELSPEQIGLLDSDVLILLTNGAEPDDIPGYAALPAVATGAVAILDFASVTGLNTPSPLSVAYALDAIRPALEAAAAATS